MKVRVYVDGFNLYYGALQGTPFKWLDVSKLSSFLLKDHEITKVKYFTAPLKVRAGDSDPEKSTKDYLQNLNSPMN